MIHRPTSPKLYSVVALALALAFGTVSAPVDAQDAPAAPGITERFDDWVLSCVTPAGGTEVCEVRQALITTAENRLIAALAISKNAGDYTILGIVPLGARLQSAPTITVDEGGATSGQYVQCLGTGCRVLFSGSSSLVNGMSRGDTARIAITRANNQPLNIEFSLKGFGAAIRALDNRS